ncbi:MAG: AAA-like domain-containing protein [Anaerolineales bacterium]|uniref:AAA-like domain-containing protein n=1 Tax=Promineifilum sp. TaxID=2664178 RepID=UPI001DEABD60|nr:AAA-like domain-containing protein [Anaerolineales bacterium]MCB8934867.1 AAA-like domain-containing protein [Promineifilum sp.]MCO5182278.1 AAA-like domain-containing protein [Promineifilum sp.]
MSGPFDRQDYFFVDGAVPFDANCYVKRPADDHLLDHVHAGELCFVLTASQMGKTSLIFRAQDRLRELKIPSAYIDLHRFGSGLSITVEVWCRSFLNALASQLELNVSVLQWWSEQSELTPIDRLLTFIDHIVGEQTGGAAIFVDEIGTIQSLDFGDDFINGIRSLYQSFHNKVGRQRVAFVLIGMISPDQLLRDRVTARLNIGSRVYLGYLALEDAGVLLAGLPDQNRAILERVFYWTHGHPYLTQRICLAIAKDESRTWNNEAVDDVVYWLLLVDRALELDSNLAYVRDAILLSPHKDKLARLYRDIRRGRRIRNLEQSPLHRELRFSGLVQIDERGDLVVANRIYQQVFNEQWLDANSPFRWWQAVPRYAWAAVGLIIVLAVLLGASLVRATRSEQEARQQRNLALARSLTADGASLMNSQYDLALLLGVEAYHAWPTTETEAFLRYSLLSNPYIDRFIRGHEARVNRLAFAPDGSLFVSGDDDGRLIIWDATDRTPLWVAPAVFAGGVSALTVAHDAAYVVAAGCAEPMAEEADCHRGLVALWDTANGLSRWSHPAHDGRVQALAVSADDHYLATASESSLIVWDPATGAVVWEYEPAGGQLSAVAFDPVDPDRLVFGRENGDIGIVDVSAQIVDLTFAAQAGAVADMAFSPDGRLLVTAGSDGHLALWNTSSWEPGPSFLAHDGPIFDIDFGADGRLFSSGADGKIYGWDLPGLDGDSAHKRLTLTAQGSTNWSIATADTPQGQALLSVGADNAIVQWAPSGDPSRGHWLADQESGILGLDFGASGNRLATSSEDGTIKLWAAGPDAPAQWSLITVLEAHDGPARRVAFGPRDESLASVGRDGRLILWDLRGSRPQAHLLGQDEAIIRTVAFAPDGQRLATADDRGRLWVWRLGTTDSGPAHSPIQAHDREIFDVVYSPDGLWLVTGSWDGTVRFWDAATLQPSGLPIATGLDQVWDLAFSPDGRLLAVAGSSETVPIIDVDRRAIDWRLLTNQTTRINALAFSSDGSLLATGSFDSMIVVWEMATRQAVGVPLSLHSAAVYDLAFSPDDRLLASADLGGGLFISVLAYDDLVATACAIAARNLTAEERLQYVGQAITDDVACVDFPNEP